MWTNLLKNLPWRSLLLAVVINAFLIGLYYLGYKSGHENATRDGDKAISELQSAFDTYKTEQATLENAALRAWAKRYQPLAPALGQRPGDLKPLTPGYATQASPSVTSSPTSSTTRSSAAAGAAR